MVPGIVHQPDMIFKLGIETNREHVFIERNGMGFEQISARELADAPDAFEKLGPQVGQISIERKSGDAVCLIARLRCNSQCFRL